MSDETKTAPHRRTAALPRVGGSTEITMPEPATVEVVRVRREPETDGPGADRAFEGEE